MATGKKLSAQELWDLVRAAGFSPKATIVMMAIVMAESGGDPKAHNYNPRTGDDSYGLAQINMLGALGPDRRKRYQLASNDQLLDPATNLRVAYELSGRGSNFSPWSTFKSGAYKQYLPKSSGGILDQAGDAFGDAVGDAKGAVVDPVVGAVAGMFGAAVDPFVQGLKRLSVIGIVVLGGVALIVAGAWRGVKAPT